MTRLVDDWVGGWAATRPGTVAVADGEHTWTYRELDQVAAWGADVLRDAGVVPGARVALLAADTAVTVAAIHAVRRTGAILVPLNRRGAGSELRSQLRGARVGTLLHDATTAQQALEAWAGRGPEAVGGTLVDLAALAIPGAPSGERHPAPRVDLDAPATILFTSGTTAAPRPAVLTHGNHAASADAWATRLDARPTDRWLACLPLYHVGGLATVFRASRWGVPLEVHERFDAGTVSDAIDRGTSHLSLVEVLLERLLEVRGDRLAPPTLRAILLGGGPLRPDLVRTARGRGLPVVTTYGMTETASGVVADGRALPSVELRIAAPGADGIGEIHVRGPMVFVGYDGDPDATAAVLQDGWLRTGDGGAMVDDGALTIADRREDMIVSGGENIAPAEVEAVLVMHPAVVAAAVVGRPDERWGSVPVAFVVIRGGDDVRDEDLARHCRERLAGYKVPRAFRRVRALPRAPDGKLRRRELRS